MALAAAYHPRSSSCLYVCYLDRLMARARVLVWETWRTGVLDTFFSTTLSVLSWLTVGESDLFVDVSRGICAQICEEQGCGY